MMFKYLYTYQGIYIYIFKNNRKRNKKHQDAIRIIVYILQKITVMEFLGSTKIFNPIPRLMHLSSYYPV